MSNVLISLIIVGLSLMIYVVGMIFGNRKRFRRELSKRGISVQQIREYGVERGIVVIDYVYGRSIGLGSVTVWWNAFADDSEVQADNMQDYVSESSLLVDVPYCQRNSDSMKEMLPSVKVVKSTWLPIRVKM